MLNMDVVYSWNKYTICSTCVKTTAVLGDRKNHVIVFWYKKKRDKWLNLERLWIIYGLEVTSKGRTENILNFNSGKTEVLYEKENSFWRYWWQNSTHLDVQFSLVLFGEVWKVTLIMNVFYPLWIRHHLWSYFFNYWA